MVEHVHTAAGIAPAEGFVAPRTLKWAHELDFEPRDIEPGPTGRRADLCYTIATEPLLYFFAGPQHIGVRTVFPANPYNGIYRVRVFVDSVKGKAVPDAAEFDVFFNGDWRSVRVTPVNHPDSA